MVLSLASEAGTGHQSVLLDAGPRPQGPPHGKYCTSIACREFSMSAYMNKYANRLTLAAVMAVLACSAAIAQATDDPRAAELPGVVAKALESGDYEGAYPHLVRLAEADHHEATFYLGNYYMCAKVVKFDCGKAEELFQRSSRPSASADSAGLVVRSKNEVAWINAACEHPGFVRKPELALRLATEAAADGDPHRVDTLAAAYANTGEYTKAIALQYQAVEALIALARTEPIEEYTVREFLKRLRLYKDAKPARFGAWNAVENCNALP